jgi:hypothetical protein
MGLEDHLYIRTAFVPDISNFRTHDYPVTALIAFVKITASRCCVNAEG